MRKFLFAVILVLCSTPVFAQSFGRVEADLLRAKGTIENIAPEATAAVVRIYTDDGDDNADKYSLNVSTADVFSIQNNGTAIWSITSAGAASAAELSLTGVTGSGKAVCVKSDGALGVCGDAVGGSGTCTCS